MSLLIAKGDDPPKSLMNKDQIVWIKLKKHLRTDKHQAAYLRWYNEDRSGE
jgi:hypothetical protein